jgi:hypothetical protein
LYVPETQAGLESLSSAFRGGGVTMTVFAFDVARDKIKHLHLRGASLTGGQAAASA